MHAVFIPYGKRSEVELMLRDMEAQKHLLKMSKGKEEQKIWIQSQIRTLPLGAVEYIFPKEDMDMVLTTLNFGRKDRYELGKAKMLLLRKLFNCRKIPKFNKDKKYLWITENVSIIPIGIRDDTDLIEPYEAYKGWTHEAI